MNIPIFQYLSQIATDEVISKRLDVAVKAPGWSAWNASHLTDSTNWTKDYPQCDGFNQSPIDIETQIVRPRTEYDFEWLGYDTAGMESFILFNSGHGGTGHFKWYYRTTIVSVNCARLEVLATRSQNFWAQTVLTAQSNTVIYRITSYYIVLHPTTTH